MPRAASRPLPRRSCRTLGPRTALMTRPPWQYRLSGSSAGFLPARRRSVGIITSVGCQLRTARYRRPHMGTSRMAHLAQVVSSSTFVMAGLTWLVWSLRLGALASSRLGHFVVQLCRKQRCGSVLFPRLASRRALGALETSLLGAAFWQPSSPCWPMESSGCRFCSCNLPAWVSVASVAHAVVVARKSCSTRVTTACRGLTPPSSGRPKGRFAPFAPPLMSNVRSHEFTSATSRNCSRYPCLATACVLAVIAKGKRRHRSSIAAE